MKISFVLQIHMWPIVWFFPSTIMMEISKIHFGAFMDIGTGRSEGQAGPVFRRARNRVLKGHFFWTERALFGLKRHFFLQKGYFLGLRGHFCWRRAGTFVEMAYWWQLCHFWSLRALFFGPHPPPSPDNWLIFLHTFRIKIRLLFKKKKKSFVPANYFFSTFQSKSNKKRIFSALFSFLVKI